MSVNEILFGLLHGAARQFGGAGTPAFKFFEKLCELIPNGPPGPPGGATEPIIYRPGAPTAPPFYATDAEIAAIINAEAGDVTVDIDSSIVFPAPWAQNVDGLDRLTLRGTHFSAQGPGDVLEIAAGFTIKNIAFVERRLGIEGNAQLVSPVTLGEKRAGRVSSGALGGCRVGGPRLAAAGEHGEPHKSRSQPATFHV